MFNKMIKKAVDSLAKVLYHKCEEKKYPTRGQAMAVSVYDVANYFLSLVDYAAEDCISNLKLQKLCYYAQGFYLAMHNERLFDSTLQAWQYGPVVPELYHKYKDSGSSCLMPSKDFKRSSLPEEIISFLDEIYAEYGQYSAWRLKDMTHNETPWMLSYNNKKNDEISDELMKSFFKTRLA